MSGDELHADEVVTTPDALIREISSDLYVISNVTGVRKLDVNEDVNVVVTQSELEKLTDELREILKQYPGYDVVLSLKAEGDGITRIVGYKILLTKIRDMHELLKTIEKSWLEPHLSTDDYITDVEVVLSPEEYKDLLFYIRRLEKEYDGARIDIKTEVSEGEIKVTGFKVTWD